jgi:hypothetical protein
MSDETSAINECKALAIRPPVEVHPSDSSADRNPSSGGDGFYDGNDGPGTHDASSRTSGRRRKATASAPVLPSRSTMLSELMELTADLQVRRGRLHGSRILQVNIHDDGRSRWVATASESFSDFIRGMAFERLGVGPKRELVDELVQHVEGRGIQSGLLPIGVRHVFIDDSLYVGRGPDADEAILIDEHGYRVVESPPVMFQHSPYAGTLPIPESGGDLALLRRYFPNLTERDFIALLGFIIASFVPNAPFPVLIVTGPADSGKSTLNDIVRRILDPMVGFGARTMLPETAEDLVNVAVGRHLASFDNVSGLSNEMSDALCGLATGTAWEGRQLFAQGITKALMVRCPVILNGVTISNLRADLSSRAVPIETQAFPVDEDSDENQLRSSLDRDLPKILGFVCRAVAAALRDWRGTSVTCKHRLRDCIKFVTAAEPALGLPDGAIAAAWIDAQVGHREELADADPVAALFWDMLPPGRCPDGIRGPANQIFERVAEYEKIFNKKRPAGFPADSGRLASHLRRNRDVLKRGGILVEQLQRTASERGWWIRRAPATVPAEPTTVKVTRPGTKANELVREIDALTDSQKGGRTSAA